MDSLFYLQHNQHQLLASNLIIAVGVLTVLYLSKADNIADIVQVYVDSMKGKLRI